MLEAYKLRFKSQFDITWFYPENKFQVIILQKIMRSH
jgi:hypothetical protein